MDTFFKGNQHHAALIRNLGGSVAHTNPGQNVAVKIAKSSKDELLSTVDHRRDPDAEAERQYIQRKTALEREQAERAHSARGKGAKGSFAKLRERVKAAISGAQSTAADMVKALQALGSSSAAMAKSVRDDNEGFERYGSDFAFAYSAEPVTTQHAATVRTKPTAATFQKSINKVNSMLKSMGLEAGYGTDSATLTGGSALRKQSLDKRLQSTVVGGDPEPTGEQILKAAGAALYAGQIDAKDAQAIQHQVNMRGTCEERLLKKLRGDDSDIITPKLLTKSQCHAAASKGLQTGAITGAEAMHIDMSLSLDKPVDDGVMQKLRAIHGGQA